jgi:GNAT superfamily N-acetyltransferase
VTALIDTRLHNERGQPFGQLGFFECINNLSVARLLIEAASQWLREKAPGMQTVLAPINFDTWHPYRLRTKGFDQPTFLMEPYNPSYYLGLFTSLGLSPVSRYVTKTVTEPSALMISWESYYRDAVARGYRFRSFDLSAVNAEMSLIYQLSLVTFRDNLFFVGISEAEFRALYSGVSGSLDPDLLVFLLDPAGEPVGISFSVKDHRHPGTVNLKTFGILPPSQKTGLGAALAWETYRRFQDKGFTCVNHCLMRAGNRADQFDHGLAEITREYSLYSRSLRP